MYFRKILKVMKISAIILMIGMLHASATVFSQNNNISVNFKNMTLIEAIKYIEAQTDYLFLYNVNDINNDIRVNIKIDKQSIEKVLDALLKDTGLEYIVRDKHIVLLLKKEAETTAVKTQPGISINGSVSDDAGEPMPGVSVFVRGTNTGVITDVNGKFTITVPNAEAVLVFSFMGFHTQEIIVGVQRLINVSLVEAAANIEEVVVVGYGVQKKVSVTGAVSSANTKDLKVSASASIANALAGRVSGLTSIQGVGGQPGRDDASMYLRGAATTNGMSPLILIDGVPRDNIRTIDPNEVESITVLKDASATAVFGVRGANGVLMITTKRGKEGKAELSVTATQSFSALTREPDRLSSLEYMKYRNEALANDKMPTPFTPDVIAKWENPLAGLNPSDPDYAQKVAVRNYMYPNNDYYRMLIKRWTPQTVVNANLTGGTDKISYFMNVGYLHQGGVLNTEPKEKLGYDPSSKLDRYNFRTNLDYQVTPRLSVFINLGTYIESVNMPTTDDTDNMMRNVFYHAQYLLPISPGPYTIDGFGVEPGLLLQPTFLNSGPYTDLSPFDVVNYRGYRNETRANLNSSIGANWDLGFITPGLSLKGMLSFDSLSDAAITGSVRAPHYMANINPEIDELTFTEYSLSYSRLSLSRSTSSRYSLNAQASILYNRKLGRHDVGGMVLAQRDYWESVSAEIPFNVIGVAGRVTYNYDARYFGEVNLGYNGSEQFAPGKRYGFFPAVSAGWVVSNESFLSENEILTFLKLRASTGLVGNDRIGGQRFLYMDDIEVAGGGYLGSLAQGRYLREGRLGNKKLTWELAQKYNLGVDIHIMHDIKASIDVFKENRSQILLQRRTVPALQGVPINNIPRINMGEVENQGFEIELTYTKQITKDMFVELRGNFGYNQNKRMNVDEVPRDDTYYYQYRATGYPIGQHWGYEIDWGQDGGYWTPQSLADPNRIPYGFGEPRPGDFVYKNLNGDSEVNDRDLAPIGCGTIPRISWGASAYAQYKGFDAYIFFQGLSQYYGAFALHGTYETSFRGAYFPYHRTAWTEERWRNGDKITYPALSTMNNVNLTENSFFIFNRSFARLKNAEIGYTLPASLLKVAGVSKMRIYVSGQNIFTWSPKFRLTHLDPENDDSIGYPQTKTFSFGANIIF